MHLLAEDARYRERLTYLLWSNMSSACSLRMLHVTLYTIVRLSPGAVELLEGTIDHGSLSNVPGISLESPTRTSMELL